MKREAVVGIDIGGTFTKFGIVDKEGNCYFEGSVPTQSDENESVEAYVANLSTKIKSVIGNFPDLEIRGLGIGVPNGNYYRGTIEHAANLKWKGIVPLADLFRQYFTVPVVLTNDANAAAIGEMVYGGAKNMRDFIVITLGTGLGSGIVANGHLLYGHDGFAGELGHVTVYPEGRVCGCGRRGCLETYVSATGIKRTVFELLAQSMVDSPLRNIPYQELTAENIAKYAQLGDRIALEAFDFTAKILGQKLADAVAFTSPEAIFIFGGLAKAGDLLLAPTRKYFEESLLPVYRNKIKILLSEMTEVNAAVLGAGALAWSEIQTKNS
ncbi:MAG TPA: ROK family protein [Bacteroidales bacterium]|nr:ROK family protein [Bacteroidales bacterium]HOK98702.1 ROK family protein [Bacteroidales bacterium]HPO65600.1 ROK family protein [Bacteroidales bacterium]